MTTRLLYNVLSSKQTVSDALESTNNRQDR